MRITWDRAKAARNLAKHRVAFEEAASALEDPRALTIEDEHYGEQRFVTVGSDLFGKMTVVVFTYPDKETIRIISARKATKHERAKYEKGI